jgi:hypothetical protein
MEADVVYLQEDHASQGIADDVCSFDLQVVKQQDDSNEQYNRHDAIDRSANATSPIITVLGPPSPDRSCERGSR